MSEGIAEIRRRLLAWYDADHRDLPWRRTRDPYRIWVSEVMLQQTRVETVVPYYERWIERFPTVEAVADVELDDVLTMWAGLGYYSRARNLHRAARILRERHDGMVPESLEELRALPGIGPYTAGAIASMAFGAPEPAVDGNVTRVLSRLLDLPSPGERRLRDLAATLMDPDRPGDLNQAVMELGARVCTPVSPRCDVCPVSGACLALARDTVSDRPARKPRRARPRRRYGVAVVARPDGRVLLRRRPSRGLLGGMFEFPNEQGPSPEEAASAVLHALGLRTGADPTPTPLELGSLDHVFTHFQATYDIYLFRVDAPIIIEEGSGEVRWVDPGQIERLALPAAHQRMAALARDALDLRGTVRKEIEPGPERRSP